MNAKLTTLSGPGNNFSALEPHGLPNFEAGLLFLGLANQVFPGITWRDLFSFRRGQSYGQMSGWLTDLGHFVGNVKDGVGDIISDTVRGISDQAGSAVRLITDEQVIGGITKAAAAYATDGASLAMEGMTPQQKQIVETAGANYKASFGGATGEIFKSPIVWVLGGVTVLSLGAFILKKR